MLISIEKIKEDILAQKEIVVLDVRDRSLFLKFGNIGGTNYPISETKKGLLDPRQDFSGYTGKIIFICSGNGINSMRTAEAYRFFNHLGLKNLYRLNTSLFKWVDKYGKLDRIPDYLRKIKAKNG